MKKKQTIVFLTLIVIILVLTFICITLFHKIKNFDNNNCNCSQNKEDQNINTQLICYKNFKEEDYNSTIKYIIEIKENCSVSEYKKLVIGNYSDNEKYNNHKKLKPKDSVLTYDDSKKQITRTYENIKITDINNKEINIWYIDYKNQLEDDGYKCTVE